MNKYMEIAKNKSIKGFKNKEGGPFGAVITDKEGNIEFYAVMIQQHMQKL